MFGVDLLSAILSAVVSTSNPKPGPVSAGPEPTLMAMGEMGTGAPSISVYITPTPNPFLCMSKAQSAMYSIGASAMTQDSNSYGGTVAGNTRVLVWCRSSDVVIIGAGPMANAAVQQVRSQF